MAKPKRRPAPWQTPNLTLENKSAVTGEGDGAK
jgi:hypothetical protein